MAVSVTPRQREVLRYVAGHVEAKGYAPTRQNVSDNLCLCDKAKVQYFIEALEERGAVRRTARVSRGIEVLTPITIPRAPDGAPLFFVRIEEAQ